MTARAAVANAKNSVWLAAAVVGRADIKLLATLVHTPPGCARGSSPHSPSVVPATIMIIVAALLVFVTYLQVRDRWRDPEIKTTEQAEHSTTGVAVRNAGAQLSPTEPKPSVEPDVPKAAQPADSLSPANSSKSR